MPVPCTMSNFEVVVFFGNSPWNLKLRFVIVGIRADIWSSVGNLSKSMGRCIARMDIYINIQSKMVFGTGTLKKRLIEINHRTVRTSKSNELQGKL